MQKQVTHIIEHMAYSHWELAKILEYKRHAAVRMAQLVDEIPHEDPTFGTVEGVTDHSLLIVKNVATYLNSLADLADAIGDNLTLVMKEAHIPDGEE